MGERLYGYGSKWENREKEGTERVWEEDRNRCGSNGKIENSRGRSGFEGGRPEWIWAKVGE